MKQTDGSITVFLTLVLVLILSFVFSLLEAARVQCLKSQSTMNAAMCLQSMFGNYNVNLWEDYHLLFLDGTWQQDGFSIETFSGRAMEDAGKNLDYAGDYGEINFTNLSQLAIKNIEVTGYELATDAQGKVLRKQAASQIRQETVTDAIQELTGLLEKGNFIESKKGQAESGWKSAWEAIQNAEVLAKQAEESEETEGNNEGEPIAAQEPVQTVENPMDYVKSIKDSSILALVMENPSELSVKAVEAGNFLSDRELYSGNLDYDPGAFDADRLWFQYYIGKYFSNCAKSSSGGPVERALSYEMEYIIGGKAEDSKNLEKVVYELLLIRETANFLSLLQDNEKRNIARGIATATVGFTGLAPLVYAVQTGVLLAWAYVESILDIRALLAGKKVPLIKIPGQWKSDLANCRQSVESGIQSEEDSSGLDYGSYLQLLLLLLSDKTLNYRCMDLMEKNLQLTGGNENVRMDAMIQTIKADFFYEAHPLFWNLIFVNHSDWEHFSFEHQQQISYTTQ